MVMECRVFCCRCRCCSTSLSLAMNLNFDAKMDGVCEIDVAELEALFGHFLNLRAGVKC
jgi:hypothetical protein